MKKVILGIGLILLLAGIILFILAGSTSGPNFKPTVPAIYGTNQGYWTLLAFVGLVITIVGLVTIVIQAVKKRRG